MADRNLTDRATIIAAGILANPHLVELRDLAEPDAIATHAVRIAHAVRRAAKTNPSGALPKPPKAPKPPKPPKPPKQKKSKRNKTPILE
jgi:hypothetical protein